jgi:hypothetical protein
MIHVGPLAGLPAGRLGSRRSSPVELAILSLLVAAVVVGLAPAVAVAAVPGDHLWAKTVSTTGIYKDESAVAVATDAAGYPIVVGDAVTSFSFDTDIRHESYDLSGILRWSLVKTTWDYRSNVGSMDTPAGVAVDDARNCVYVAGTVDGVGTGRDLVVLKLLDADPGGTADGDLIWQQTYDAGVGRDDEAEAIALDKYGNVYVTGGSQRADGTWDVLTVKYRPDGAFAWARRHNNSTTRFDRGLAIAVRGTAVYVAGVSNRLGHRDDVVLIRYSLAGERQWVRYYDDALTRHETVTAVAPTAGAVYVCGAGRSTATLPGDALLLKYLSDGTRAWVRWVAGSGGGDDIWEDVAADDLGRAHVTGRLFRDATGDDAVTRLYRTGGTLLWQRSYSGVEPRSDAGTALALDAVGRTYVCGYRTGTGGDVDVLALKYGTTGTTLWATTYPDPVSYLTETDDGDDRAFDIAVGATQVYVVGFKTKLHQGYYDTDFLTLAILR